MHTGSLRHSLPQLAAGRLAPAALQPVRGYPGCVVFECVGVAGVLDATIKGCERGTRVFSAGGPPQGDHLHTLTAKRKGLLIQFGGGPLPAHWDGAFEAICSGTVDVRPLLGHQVGLDEVPRALDAARGGSDMSVTFAESYGPWAVIAGARGPLDDALRERIYEQRVLAESMISRPVMKGFKAQIRAQGLFAPLPAALDALDTDADG